MARFRITRAQRKREQRIAEYVTRPPRVLYDVGVGAKSEWRFLPEVFPGLQVVGVEPNPQQCDWLRDHGFYGMLHQVALGSESGRRRLYLTPDHPNVSSFFDTPGATSSIDVEVWTLDELDERSGRPDGLMLWMDCEGAELQVLQSGPQLMSSGRVRWLNLEVRDSVPAPGWATAASVHAHLTEIGYVRVTEYGHCQSHRDVIYRHADEPYKRPQMSPRRMTRRRRRG